MAQASPGLERMGPSDSISHAELVEHLEGVCASGTFEGSTTLKNLLRYLFQNRHKQFSEYEIAVEALGRREDFDQQLDASVRVQISRLRRRLRDYYRAEGRLLPIRFSVPLGTHQLSVNGLDSEASATSGMLDPIEIVQATPRQDNFSARLIGWRPLPKLVVALVCLTVGLSCVILWQFFEIAAQKRALGAGPAPAAMLPLWKEFSANGKPIEIVLPNPTFFSWQVQNREVLMARDTTVNSFPDLEKAPDLKGIEEKFGKPTLSQQYAVSSDVIASLKLLRYMDAGSQRADIAISSDAPSDLFEGDNIILVGTPGTLAPFKNQLDRLYLEFDPQGWAIQNRQPRAGEQAVYSAVFESPTRVVSPGLIAVLPGISKDTRIMIIAGQSTAALVWFLTSSEGSQQLEKARRQAGGGPYFEAVIMSELAGDTILNNRLAVVRPYSPSAPRN